MIRSFSHKGLREFFLTGSKKGIQAEHEKRLRLILIRLHSSLSAEDMDLPGLKLHPLKATLRGHFAVTLSGNWRVVFRFEGNDAFDVDYQDYH
ncbi:MAG: type II toxin-antitoxin system RelE/ParE family toxin [Thermodesulfobacteriota bacterium]